MMTSEATQRNWKIHLVVALLVSLVQYSSGVDLGFGEVDYTQFENLGSVSIDVFKLQGNNEQIIVNIIPLTFEQFANTPGLTLPSEIVPQVANIDPAERDGTRNDFDNAVQQVIFELNPAISEQSVSINLVDEFINEAQEGFYVMIEVMESGPTDVINLIRNGIALIRIDDNDPITLGFTQIDYTVQEDTGIFQPGPVAIVKEGSRISEQILSINVEFSPDTAAAGLDFNGNTMLVTLNPEDVSVEIAVTIINDNIVEDTELFLGSLSIPDNPPSGLGPSPTASTATITIVDDEVATIGFEQASYTFREGDDTVAEVCFSILSPPVDQIDPTVFALLNVEPFEDSAQVNVDYTLPVDYVRSALLDRTISRDCRSVNLIDDTTEEAMESFIFRLTLSTGQFDVFGNFQVTLPQTEVVILDNDSQDVMVQFDPVVYSVIEEAGQSVMFRIITLTPAIGEVTVLFSTVDRTAIASADYIARISDPVIFSAGQTEQFVEVVVVDDSVLEGEEQFEATLELPAGSSGVILGPQGTATANIQDDDEVTIRFNPTTYVVREGQMANFIVELVGEAIIDVDVSFGTNDGSAIAPEDYMATTEVVTFSPGMTNRTVSVQTVSDSLIEGDETFNASLSLVVANSGGVNLVDNIATATIQEINNLVLTPSPTINAIEGESVEITCDTTGSEEITIQVNGVETNLQFQDSNMQRVFTFGPVSRTDQGTLFQCFRGGLSSNTAMLNVFYAPEYMFLLLYEGNEGEPLIITLGLDGNPLPPDDFTWMFDGQPLQLGGNVAFLNETTIAFSSLSRNNAGSYSVSATNLAGVGSANFDLVVFYQPEYSVDPSFTVNEGNIFNLPTLNLDANPTPGAGNFTWTFNGQPLVEQSGVDLDVNSILINSVLRNQSGVYMIVSFNRAGSGGASFALNVNYAPTYIVDERFMPTEGTQFRVDPILDANPIPGIGMFEWTFNGQPIGPQLPGAITGVDFLDFGSSIGREASGNYTITSFNEAGSGNASFTIDVLYPPMYSISSTTFVVIQGQMFDLELGLDANPFPENATWFFNGQPLPMIMGIELGVNFIRIQMVTQLDEGMYTVQTSNNIGMDTISFQLEVEVAATTVTEFPNPTPTPAMTSTDLRVDQTGIPLPTQTPESGGMGGDPHFSILLPSGQLLCFSVQGEHGFVFSLLSNKIIHMNAKFVPDSQRSEVTWIGSLGMIVRSKQANTTSKLRFEADSKTIHINDKASLNAQSVKKLTITRGKLNVAESNPSTAKSSYPKVEVDLQDVGIGFTIRFVRDHIDMVWNKVRKQPKDSHGIIGQFFRDHVEIDESRRLLLLPNVEPVAVVRKPVWHFMERDEAEDQLCWVAMNPGYQGKKLIEGHYLDYLVDDVLSSRFNFKPGRYKRNLEELLSQR